MLKGIEDFLAGPSVLRDGGQAALAAIRAERKAYPETSVHPADNIPGVDDSELITIPAAGPPRADLIDAILAKRVAGQLSGRLRPEFAYVTSRSSQWWHVSQFSRAVVSDASQSGVRVRRRDAAKAKELLLRAAKLRKRFIAEAGPVSEQYRAAVPQLTSEQNWLRLWNS
jgi:galactofuranosylgalactofuranosylrhamnosyl-N-acetylglucosaminyl-diphospho-decaprenol beta-1,5/1,6-galactofuranosyltransferase